MTKERAIQLAKKWSKGLACSLREGEAEEYHKMFLEMLCDESNPRELMRLRVDGSRPEEDYCSECGAKMTIKE